MACLAKNAPIPSKTVRALDPGNVAADKKTFYDRFDSNIIARSIKNALTPEGYDSLLIEKGKLSFVDTATGLVQYDEPTLL